MSEHSSNLDCKDGKSVDEGKTSDELVEDSENKTKFYTSGHEDKANEEKLSEVTITEQNTELRIDKPVLRDSEEGKRKVDDTGMAQFDDYCINELVEDGENKTKFYASGHEGKANDEKQSEVTITGQNTELWIDKPVLRDFEEGKRKVGDTGMAQFDDYCIKQFDGTENIFDKCIKHNIDGAEKIKDENIKLEGNIIGDSFVVNMNEEVLNESGPVQENIIDILTEKQVEPIIEGRRRKFFVGFQQYQREPVGSPVAESSDRNWFVRRVLMLVAIMLLITIGFTYLTIQSTEIKRFMLSPAGLILLAIAIGVQIALNYVFCCSGCASQVPCNYIILVIAVAAYSYVVGFITWRFDPYIIFIAALTTFAITLFCLAMACTSIDFTNCLMIVFVAGLAIALALLGSYLLSALLGINLKILRLVLLVASCVVSSVCLIIELQMILGGKNIELGEDEYVYGAYMVYTSIIDMFLKLLIIVQDLVGLDQILE